MFPSVAMYICNCCNSHMVTRHQCTVCNDFDLCIDCYEKEKHPHTMEKLSHDVVDGSSPTDQQAEPQEPRRLTFLRYNKFLVHASQCNGCHIETCSFMRRVLQHVQLCRVKCGDILCRIYCRYFEICIYHATYCIDSNCPVFFCLNLKSKIAEQQLQRSRLLPRTTAKKNKHTISTTNDTQ